MLFRRVAEHFRKQEWTAIGIDLVITVLGVFIGIQTANWNAARIDQTRAHTYLERIHADLQADISNYNQRIEFWSSVSRYGRTCLSYADTGDAHGATQWQILLGCFQASQLDEYFTTSATYDELKGAGELSLIGKVELRNELASYYTNAANPTLSERPTYRVHVRGVIPLEVQDYIWTHCYGSSMSQEQTLLDCVSPTSEARAREVVNAIRGDRALMAELCYWMSTMTVAALIGRDRTGHATQLSQAVEAELGR